MHVNPQDGRCRSCNGELDIVAVSDVAMTVECASCGDSFDVETDALHDGGIEYYVGFLAEQTARGDDAP